MRTPPSLMCAGRWGLLAFSGISVLAATGVLAETATRAGRIKGAAAERQPLPEPAFSMPLARQYCEAARDAAAEARHAFHASQLDALARKLEERLALLESRSIQLKEWVARRDAFAARSSAQLVGIFAAMRPEAASEQLVRIDGETAASILSKLDSRAASAILNDMPPEKAARLTSILAEAARKSDAASKP